MYFERFVTIPTPTRPQVYELRLYITTRRIVARSQQQDLTTIEGRTHWNERLERVRAYAIRRLKKRYRQLAVTGTMWSADDNHYHIGPRFLLLRLDYVDLTPYTEHNEPLFLELPSNASRLITPEMLRSAVPAGA